MGYKKIIGILLVFALVLSGCNTKEQTVDTTDESASSVTADTTATSETTTAAPSETEAKSTYKFNPHLYSKTVGDAIPDDYYQALYNLIDALREGKDTFECPSQEAYDWATLDTTLNNLFPAACMKVTGVSNDGTIPYENGIGRIYYKMPADEFVIREAEYEAEIEEVLNTWLEDDDTDFEKCLKLYDYMESTFIYGNPDPSVTGDGADYCAFECKTGICEHIASIYAYLLMQSGVEAINIGIFEPDMCHAWTYVVIDGQGYHVDATWSLKKYIGTDDLYLAYFMMSDDLRISTGCLLNDITAPLLPRYWASFYEGMEFKATDKSYEFPNSGIFKELDEENKILYYYDLDNNLQQMSYA